MKKKLTTSKTINPDYGQDQELATHEGIVLIDGLMWEKETHKERMNWHDAMEYAKNLRLGGYDDWRLPTMEELEGIVAFCGGKPCFSRYDANRRINRENKTYQKSYMQLGFTSSFYWSSSTCSENSKILRFLGFLNGSSDICSPVYRFYVRCVRDGQ